MKTLLFHSSNEEVAYFAENVITLSGRVTPTNWFDKPRNFTDCLTVLGLDNSLLLLSYCPSVIDGQNGWNEFYAAGAELKELGKSLGRDFKAYYDNPSEVGQTLINEFDILSNGKNISSLVETIITKYFC